LRDELQTLARPARRRWLGYVAAAALGITLLFVARGFMLGQVTAVSNSVLPAGTSPAIAVLPFKNLVSGSDSQLVVDGLTSEIALRLAAIDGLTIQSSGPSPRYRDPAVDIRAVGRELNVNLVLTGTVWATDDQVHASAELVRVADLATVWRETFSGGGDAALTHNAISIAIVNQLRLQVGLGQRRYLLEQLQPDAYYLFLTAQGLLSRRRADNAERAAALFEQVITRDREYAPAWAGLASALGALYRTPQAEASPPPNPRMDEAAREAMRIDQLLPESQSAMGSLYARDRNWPAAEEAFKQALRLSPRWTTTHTEFVLWVLLPMGRHQEALALLKNAIAVDPRSLDLRRVMALVQVNAGLYADAIVSAQLVLDQDAAFPYAETWLGRALALSGHEEEARAIFERDHKLFGYLGYVDGRMGRRAEAEALVTENPGAWSRLMLIYAGLGERDLAMDALEKTADLNWWRAAEWLHRPEMALLRGDTRLDALKKRLGLPQ
jgi:TolB-like protein/Tfp pilus assembly protein PilF